MASLSIYKASAGSGKTFRLALHFIKSIIKVDSPEQYAHILAVTFTNKATAEMKDRILSTLYGIGHNVPSSQSYYEVLAAELKEEGAKMTEEDIRTKCRQCLTNILHDYNRFRVQTIDSFFQMVLRGMAHELGLNPNLQVDLRNEDVLAKAVDSVIDHVNDNREIYAVLYDIVSENIEKQKSYDVAKQVVKFGKAIFKEDYLKRSADLETVLNEPKNIRAFDAEMRKTEEQTINDSVACAKDFEKWIAEKDIDVSVFAKGRYLLDLIDKLEEGGLANCEPSETVRGWAEDAESLLRKADQRKPQMQALAAEVSDYLKDFLQKIADLQKQYRSAFLARKNIKLLCLLGFIDKEVRKINEEASRFNLSKTQILLNEMIDGSDAPFVFEKIGALLQEVMIDEFQDTSWLQWKNFCVLLLETFARGGDNLIVGDVKQSIYRFRGGDWRILGNIEENKRLNAVVYPLDTNRRSDRNVVNFNNCFFTDAMAWVDEFLKNQREVIDGDFSFVKAYEGVAQSVPEKKPERGFVRVAVMKKGKKDDERDVKAEILDDLKQQVRELYTKGVPYEEMMILVRKNKQADSIIQAFSEEEDLPEIVSDEAFFLSSSEVVIILIEMLRLLDNQEDAVAAYYLAQRNIDVEKVKGFGESLQSESLYDLLEHLYRCIDISRYPQQDAYVFAFFDAVMEYMHSEATDIKAFLTYWDETLIEQTIPSAQVKGIRVTTVHKSKGLEFHTVLIPFADWTFYSKKEDDITWCDPQDEPYRKMKSLPIHFGVKSGNSIFAKDYAEDYLMSTLDELNNLYVAFTRAKSNLLIWTQEATNNIGGVITNVVSPNFLVKGVDEKQGNLIKTLESEYCTVFEFGEMETFEADEKSVNSRMMPLRHTLSVTKQSIEQMLVFKQSNQSDLFCKLLDEDVSGEPLSQQQYLQTGSLLHRVLQDIDTADAIPRVLDGLEAEGLLTSFSTETETTIPRNKIETLLKNGLKKEPVKNWFSGCWKVMNECSILVKGVDGMVVTRRPDRVMINEEGNHIIVVDYKFGGMKPDYKAQVAEYMELLQAMYPQAQVEGFLWFVYTNKVVAL